ncbi:MULTISPECIES: hypothetical protein [unclassified Bifidobacterium]|uniref:hypothetical protein n=1 Tax=unclassified Bifidobacterium TaxID=2608897 RepID=UPI00112AE6B0|nr:MULTISPECIES: hypothetical protein [unclassified Bifidobacterium]TPF79341.1 hypothetical protein BW08_10585 [Bifidobacterium sp. UTCIF-24]TPF84352.1 hypothetical protein BW07_05140 [Bifidobacterium sp. UTCIF-36]TPF91031.1 hypothetical protein BW10_02095 [Bifidobacterium sp. UTBIF-56]
MTDTTQAKTVRADSVLVTDNPDGGAMLRVFYRNMQITAPLDERTVRLLIRELRKWARHD